MNLLASAFSDCVANCVAGGGGVAECNVTCASTGGSGGSGSSSIFGQIKLPTAITDKYGSDAGLAIGNLLNMVFKSMIVIAGVYALFNLIFAGYAFMSAGDDAKKVAGAWAKIWQSLLGLTIAAGAFVLAAIFGQLIFGDWEFILNPKIPEL